VIGSAVTVPNGCTSVKIRTAVRIDRWPIADAAMPERMNRRGSTVFNQRFRNRAHRQHSEHRRSLNPISARNRNRWAGLLAFPVREVWRISSSDSTKSKMFAATSSCTSQRRRAAAGLDESHRSYSGKSSQAF